MTTRVLLVDDHALFRNGLRALLEEEPDFEVVGEAEDGSKAIESTRELSPDLVVMDVAMPGVDGIEATREILDYDPAPRVVALSINTGKRFVGDMLRAGARGYVLKKSAPEDLVAALRTVARGEVYLSPAIAGIVVSEFAAEAPETSEAEDPTQLVLRTKLRGPTLSPDLIVRTRLLEQWVDLWRRPLTIVSSPAGYGKSTLASQWIESGDGPHAWLSLDVDDNDPRVFLAGLVAAIRIPFPETCEETYGLLRAGQLPPTSILARRILNDLEDIRDPFVLVLDDYHRIRSTPVHDLVTEMLRHPPRDVHLVLLTRRDPPLPVSTLRGRGQVSEFSVAEMRFSVEETTRFLEGQLEFPVDGETPSAIQEKLEGWPAGLRLLVQSLRTPADLDHVMAGLEGGFASIVDYLMDEVLSRLPKPMADFMLDASVLDQFCASLCDAVHVPGDGEEEIEGRELINRLQRDNMFLVSLDAAGRWFRFHHLFQDLLRMQLTRRRSEDDIAALHSRTAGWLAGNGHVEEAIRHFLAADDVDRATALVEEHRQTLLEEDRWYVLEKWLTVFPEEVVRQRPALLLSHIWVLDYRFDHGALAIALDEADALVEPDDPFRAEIEFFRGYLSYFGNDAPQALEHLHAALDRTPEGHHEFLVQGEMLLGMARQMAGEEAGALERLHDRLHRGRALRGSTRTRLQASIVFVHLLEGRLLEAGTTNFELHRHAKRGGYRHAEAWSHYLKGLIHFRRNELSEAVSSFDLVVQDKFIIERRVVLDSLTGLAFAHLGTGHTDLADLAMKEMHEFADSLEDPDDALVVRSAETRLSILAGDEAAVDRMLQGHPPPIENMVWWLEVPSVTYCRALLAEGSEESRRAARKRLKELLGLNRANHNVLQSIDILSLMALAEGARRTGKGPAFARQAADLAGPGGVWRPFVEAGPPMADLLARERETDPAAEHVAAALDAIGSDAAGASSPIETGPLTEREWEVLRLVAEGLSNKEIAARIHRSIETVKKHLYNTYQKLEVDGRIAALTRARELGILPGEGA